MMKFSYRKKAELIEVKNIYIFIYFKTENYIFHSVDWHFLDILKFLFVGQMRLSCLVFNRI